MDSFHFVNFIREHMHAAYPIYPHEPIIKTVMRLEFPRSQRVRSKCITAHQLRMPKPAKPHDSGVNVSCLLNACYSPFSTSQKENNLHIILINLYLPVSPLFHFPPLPPSSSYPISISISKPETQARSPRSGYSAPFPRMHKLGMRDCNE